MYKTQSQPIGHGKNDVHFTMFAGMRSYCIRYKRGIGYVYVYTRNGWYRVATLPEDSVARYFTERGIN